MVALHTLLFVVLTQPAGSSLLRFKASGDFVPSFMQPPPTGYPSQNPKGTYRFSPFESHMGPARVYSEDGFSHAGFRTMDALTTVGDAYMDTAKALPLKRKDAFKSGLPMIQKNSNFHVSPAHKSAVTFSYHNVFYNHSTAPGDKFDDVSSWQFKDQLSNSLFGGIKNAFGNFYTSQASASGFTCASWSRSDRSGYQEVQGFKLYPVAGLPELYISGHLNSLRYNSRPDGENSTISWKLVHYHDDSATSTFDVLSSGSYLLKNVGTEVPVVLEGDTTIGSPPEQQGIYVRNFIKGSVALVMRNKYTEEIPSYGHLLVCDDITWRLSPKIPYSRAVPDLSPLLVDPANGTVYSLVLTPAFPHKTGAFWHTAKAVVGYGFETSFNFRISDKSKNCQAFSEPRQRCITRGGDGFAFVIHNSEDGEMSIGKTSGGLGYSGIKNGLAVEFDSWYNADSEDPYNNHISVQTRGRDALHHAHKYSVGHTSDIFNIGDGEVHKVRIKYQPNVDLASYITRSRIRQANDRYQTSIMAYRHLMQYISKDSAHYRMGQLSIYLDSNPQPVLEIPLNLAALIGLDTSDTFGSQSQTTKAWIGFTASTGGAWQRHEIYDWFYTATPSAHANAKRPEYCDYNTLPADDDPMCHSPKLCSVKDRMESEHVGPNDPRNPRGAGHPYHPTTKYALNCNKFYQKQDSGHLPENSQQTEHLLPSDGRVTTSVFSKSL